SARVAHGTQAASLAALRHRREARHVPRRRRSRTLQPRTAGRRSRADPAAGAVSGRARRRGPEDPHGSLTEGSGTHAPGPRADRVSRDRAGRLPRRGADARSAAARDRPAIPAHDSPGRRQGRLLMSRTFACSLLASLLWLAAPAAQDARIPPGLPGTVTLTRTDYDRLLDLASVRPRGADQAPVAAALTRADIRATVAGGSARATMRVDGEAFRPGMSKVVLIKNATLLDARSDARPLPVIAEGGAHVALVAGPATFSATLEIGAPIAYAPGRASFILPVPGAGSATATIDVP